MSIQEKKSISNETTAIIEPSNGLEDYVIKALAIFDKYPLLQILVIENLNKCRVDIFRNGTIEVTSEDQQSTQGYRASLTFVVEKALEKYTQDQWKNTETARLFIRRQDYQVEKFLIQLFQGKIQELQQENFGGFISELYAIAEKLPSIPTNISDLISLLQIQLSDTSWEILKKFSPQKNLELAKTNRNSKSKKQSNERKPADTTYRSRILKEFFIQVEPKQIVQFFYILTNLCYYEDIDQLKKIVETILPFAIIPDNPDEIYGLVTRNISSFMSQLDQIVEIVSTTLSPEIWGIMETHVSHQMKKMSFAA